jgi:AcrR family transcriptional regulator
MSNTPPVYRYFRSQADLLAAAHPEVELTSLLPPDCGDDPETRLLAVVRAFIKSLLETEPQQRTMLRLSLAPAIQQGQLPLRQGRAIGWFQEALEPARDRLSEAAIHRLAIAVRSAVGVEALVWLVDVAGLTREDAAELMVSSARAIVRAGLSERADA